MHIVLFITTKKCFYTVLNVKTNDIFVATYNKDHLLKLIIIFSIDYINTYYWCYLFIIKVLVTDRYFLYVNNRLQNTWNFCKKSKLVRKKY